VCVCVCAVCVRVRVCDVCVCVCVCVYVCVCAEHVFDSTISRLFLLLLLLFLLRAAAPLGFFTANPIGRLLNRFSKDLGYVDDALPLAFFDFLCCLGTLLGTIVFVCIAVRGSQSRACV
jgi:hypothetical protein